MDAPIAAREALQLPPGLLALLPLATTLTLTTAAGEAWYVTTGAETYAELRAAGCAVFTGRELGLMALAAENGRASAAALGSWVVGRVDDPSVPLDASAALGGVQAGEIDTPDPRWPLGRVLLHYASRLIGVAVGDGLSRETLTQPAEAI